MWWTPFLVLAAAAQAQQLRVGHRLYHPFMPEAPFVERGVISLDGSLLSIQPSTSLSDDLATFSKHLAHLAGHEDHAFYQVAIERPSSTGEAPWDLSSVKACHLLTATDETFILHTNDAPDARPHAIDYFVGPIPADGGCPAGGSPFDAYAKMLSSGTLNSTISLRYPRLPPLPILRTPPPVTPEGLPVEALPEKTFLEKYWMYMAAALVALLLAGGPEEPAAK